MPIKSSPPHLRAETSVPGIMGTVVLSLLPAIFASFIFEGWNFFRVLIIALAVSLFTEWGIQKFFKKNPSLHDISSAVTALLFSLLIPSTLSSWAVALGAFFAIAVGKEIFGGLGQNPFNPALVGTAVLWASFPAGPETLAGLKVRLFMIGLGGILLIWRRIISWEIPFLYLASLFAFSWAWGPSGEKLIFSSAALIAAFFLVTDPVTTPVTRLGMRWFSVAAGLATALFQQGAGQAAAATYGVLLMNGFTPWLDRIFRPSGAKSR